MCRSLLSWASTANAPVVVIDYSAAAFPSPESPPTILPLRPCLGVVLVFPPPPDTHTTLCLSTTLVSIRWVVFYGTGGTFFTPSVRLHLQYRECHPLRRPTFAGAGILTLRRLSLSVCTLIGQTFFFCSGVYMCGGLNNNPCEKGENDPTTTNKRNRCTPFHRGMYVAPSRHLIKARRRY